MTDSDRIYGRPVEFDRDKDAVNRDKHGLSLERAAELDELETRVDDRYDYGEVRLRTFGVLDGKYVVLAWTERGSVVRAISLRRAHAAEIERYVKP